jgi:hypothetical protein
MVENINPATLSDIPDEFLVIDMMDKMSDFEKMTMEEIFDFGQETFCFTQIDCLHKLPQLTKLFWEKRGI